MEDLEVVEALVTMAVLLALLHNGMLEEEEEALATLVGVMNRLQQLQRQAHLDLLQVKRQHTTWATKYTNKELR